MKDCREKLDGLVVRKVDLEESIELDLQVKEEVGKGQIDENGKESENIQG